MNKKFYIRIYTLLLVLLSATATGEAAIFTVTPPTADEFAVFDQNFERDFRRRFQPRVIHALRTIRLSRLTAEK